MKNNTNLVLKKIKLLYYYFVFEKNIIFSYFPFSCSIVVIPHFLFCTQPSAASCHVSPSRPHLQLLLSSVSLILYHLLSWSLCHGLATNYFVTLPCLQLLPIPRSWPSPSMEILSYYIPFYVALQGHLNKHLHVHLAPHNFNNFPLILVFLYAII